MKKSTAAVSVSIFSVISLFCVPTHAQEMMGWKISFNRTTEGHGTVEWQSGSEGEVTNTEHRSYFDSFDGTYLIDIDGTVLRGSSSGSAEQLRLLRHENWLCGSGEYPQQRVSSEYGSQTSTSISGPTTEESLNVYMIYDPEAGPAIMEAAVMVSKEGTDTWWNDTYDSWTCAPIHDSGDDSFSGYTDWEYFRATASDEANLTFEYSGSEDAGCLFLYHPQSDETCIGPITRSFDVTAQRFVVPSIHGIELTQAIQVYQTLDKLIAQLEDNDGNPPVPIVAYKPLAIRVVLDQPPKTLKAIIEVSWNGKSLGSQTLTQSPLCSPPDTTALTNSASPLDALSNLCKAANFIVGGSSEQGGLPTVEVGANRLGVKLYSDDPTIGVELLNEYEFDINASELDTVLLSTVNICPTRVNGLWQCLATPVRDLRDGSSLMSKIFPTDAVTVVPSGHQVRLEVIDDATVTSPSSPDGDQWDCYDSTGLKILSGTEDIDVVDYLNGPVVKCERDMWWFVALLRMERLYSIADTWLDASGIRRYFFGLVKPNPLITQTWQGLALLPDSATRGVAIGHVAGSYGPGLDISRMDVRTIVAHEMGHLLGRPDIHANMLPADILSQCAQYDPPAGPPEVYLYSDHGGVVKREVPFDVTRRKAIDRFVRRDVMSYCPSPAWASPFNYKHLFEELRPAAVTGSGAPELEAAGGLPGSTRSQAALSAGTFWLVSGFVEEDSAFLDTVFTLDTVGPIGGTVGSHRLQVLDQAGGVLYEHRFTPSVPLQIPADPGVELPDLPLSFVEFVPVQPIGARIILRDASGSVLAEQSVAGMAPQVSIVFPEGGEYLTGTQVLTWTATDDDSGLDDLVYWVQYSRDAGSSWVTLAQDLRETSLAVDFDDLPGADGTAMIKVLASDQSRTGSAESNPFSVARKLPSVDILRPDSEDSALTGELVFFEGYAYDVDDGLLPGEDHRWSSDRDGDIGVGYIVSKSTLSSGLHQISLSASDSDSNIAFTEVQIFIEEDQDGDGIGDGSDNCPEIPNADQADYDDDSIGDACDSDGDNDGIPDLNDDYPLDETRAGDPDADGIDSLIDDDDDNDGVLDESDAFPFDPGEAYDSDDDGIGDNADNCPAAANPDQSDIDHDGLGDVCDAVMDVTSDFDLDGRSDILWRNVANGLNAVWLMDGGQRLANIGMQAADPTWSVVGLGDYNGDGTADILWRRINPGQPNNGQMLIWLLQGGEVIGTSALPSVGNDNWQVAGDGDFNGDGTSDILWRHISSGRNAMWLINDGNRTATPAVIRASVLDWEIVGDGDFDGDGKADILWRNMATGENAVWLMDGATRTANASLPSVPGSDWQVEGNADYGGDGKADILWRNIANGSNALWEMDGTTRVGNKGIPAVTNLKWSIIGDDDYNGDGNADILWRQTVNGRNAVWLMDGDQRIGSQKVPTVRIGDWEPINVN